MKSRVFGIGPQLGYLFEAAPGIQGAVSFNGYYEFDARDRPATLIVQGTRDPFGTRDEVSSYKLSKMIEIFWLEDGDHDLRLRKSVSGHSMSDHLNAMAHRVATWANNLKECR